MVETVRAVDSREVSAEYVPGFLFTLVVDKRLRSVFGPQTNATGQALARSLAEKEFGTVQPAVAEKVLRVVHTSAFLTALLGHEGQKIFWMSDHDAICANADTQHPQSAEPTVSRRLAGTA